ncbi:hypothetical protein ACPWSR_08410 [Alloiococcus sp. CFN-8]|uniref:hypothetical protein n=1 Tax=Alloiococcus sp. CFN-8 TaxID=3416081 RepID=UPI003CF139F2
MNKSLYTSIIIRSLIVIGAFYVIAYILTRSNYIALGFVVGGITRLVGFISIAISSEYISESARPGSIAAVLYIIRLIFYGFVVSWSIIKGINVISLLVGFLILNFIIYGARWKLRRAS